MRALAKVGQFLVNRAGAHRLASALLSFPLELFPQRGRMSTTYARWKADPRNRDAFERLDNALRHPDVLSTFRHNLMPEDQKNQPRAKTPPSNSKVGFSSRISQSESRPSSPCHHSSQSSSSAASA